MMINIRQSLEDTLGRPVSDQLWNYLEEKGYIEDVEVAEQPISWLAAEAKSILQATSGYSESARRSNEVTVRKDHKIVSPEDRTRALSYILYAEATKDEGVKKFRDDLLGGHPLETGEIKDWMQRAEQREHFTMWVTEVQIPDGSRLKPDEGGGSITIIPPITVSEVPNVSFRELEFFANGIEGERVSVRVRVGGRLATLAVLAVRLAREYGWTSAQAVSFVLSENIPIIEPVSWSITSTSPIAALYRINMSIDPALSPREVMERYSRARRNIVPGRHKDLQGKALYLAVFASGRAQGETWKESMSEWNTLQGNDHPDWQYSTVTNFARDCTQARNRLVNPNFNVST